MDCNPPGSSVHEDSPGKNTEVGLIYSIFISLIFYSFSQSDVFWFRHSGFLGGSEDKESTCNVGDLGSIPGLGRFPCRRAWQSTPVFLPGESSGTEEPGGLHSMGSQTVRHNRETKHRTASRIPFISVALVHNYYNTRSMTRRN